MFDLLYSNSYMGRYLCYCVVKRLINEADVSVTV